MNHYRLRTPWGAFDFNFRPENGKLSGVRWSALRPDPAQRVVMVDFSQNFARACVPVYLSRLIDEFERYLEFGEPLRFNDWNCIDDAGWTTFQRAVYAECAKIPSGETRSYSWIASRTGQPRAVRAVGQALRRNPLLILIPCHRVISAEGSLTGFMGTQCEQSPELALKRRLLEIEDRFRNPLFPFLNSAE